MRHLALGLALLLLLPLATAVQTSAQEAFFEVDSLNPGLPPPAATVNLRTAHDAMATLIDGVAFGHADDAAHALNLSDLPPARQRAMGNELARQLVEVMQRKIIIPWSDLLERPDNLDATAEAQSVASDARRSILIGRLDNGRRDTAIRLNRVKPPDGDPVWVISRETVAQIERLYALHGPTRFERAMPGSWRVETLLGLARWELVALPLLVVFAFLTGRLAYALFNSLARMSDRKWTTIALSALRWPSVIVLVTTLVLVATQWVLVFSGPINTVIQPLIAIGYVCAVLLFGLRLIDTAMRQFVSFDMGELAENDNGANRSLATTMTAARRTLVVLATVVSIGLVLSGSQLFNSLGLSLIASAGALTLILGFAAQQVLGNILASLQIAINRSARIGDQIDYEGKWCTVERINFTFVQLKVWNGDRFIVPVEHFVSESFLNYTLEDPAQERTIRLTLAHTVDLDAVRAEFERLVANQEGVTDPDQARMLVVEQDAFGPVARFQFPTDNPNIGWTAECNLRESLISAIQRLERDGNRAMLPGAALDDMAG